MLGFFFYLKRNWMKLLSKQTVLYCKGIFINIYHILDERGWKSMLWLIVVIPVVLLLVFGLVYDRYHNKSFKELKRTDEVSQNLVNARRDIKTSESSNFYGL